MKTRKNYLTEAQQLYDNALNQLNRMVDKELPTEVASALCFSALASMTGVQAALALRELAPADKKKSEEKADEK